MQFEIVDSSPRALQPQEEPATKIEFPFETLPVGKSFAIPFSLGIAEQTLRNRASREGKSRNRKYRVLKHAEGQCFEVARIE